MNSAQWAVNSEPLAAASELDDAAAVTLGGAVLRQGGILLHGLALGGFALALLFAGFRLTVEGLGHGGWSADGAEGENLNMKLAAFVLHSQHVADADVACGLGFDFVGVDASKFAGFRREGARLEETCCPKPFIDAN